MAVGWALPGAAAAEQASQPTSVAAGGIDVGTFHSCALLPSRSARCWGYGADGALGYANRDTIGDDETPSAAGPVDLGAGRTSTALSAGAVHSCARLDDGAVRCWGFGGDGRLGYANTKAIGDDEAPGSVGPVDLGVGRTATAISAGQAHSCAVLDDGMVRCWGFGFGGRLGYGATVSVGDDESPGSAGPVKLGIGRTATAVTAGGAHTCALLDDGTVRCWGLGANGQLGYGSTASVGDDETPDTAGPVRLGAGRTAVAITAGAFHTCALLDNGAVRCWGFGGEGRLGYANTDSIGDDETADAPGTVDLGVGRTAVAISAGDDHTCAVLDDGTVRCWGFGGGGRLGYGNNDAVGDDETPGSAGPVDLGAGRTAVAISAGSESTCARLDNGSVRCWGNAANGLLGSCSAMAIGDDETPGSAAVVDLAGPGIGCPAAPSPPADVPSGALPAAPSGTAGPTTPRPSRGGAPALAPDRIIIALAAQTRRLDAWRACLRGVSGKAAEDRRQARRLPAARRVGALRRLSQRAGRLRRVCLRRYGRTPGRVTTLAARTTGRHTITLTFHAPGTAYSRPPAARSYVVKQARQPLRSARDFERADALCEGRCAFRVTRTGEEITLKITDLRRRTTYYYAIAARDNVSGRPGRRSTTVEAKTL